jgi:ABC-type polysaccharide/polyol phosphate transport system ATPase subunit
MVYIETRDLKKDFKIGFLKNQGALARTLSIFSGKEPTKKVRVLDGVSFRLDGGEILGIIGKNGAGKSTLIRVLSGIYHNTGGEIDVNGNIVPIVGLGYGFQDRLSMKDNVFLSCSLLGLRRNEIKQKFSSIVEFAELQEFVITKLYQFSDGMKHRLAFSVAIHCNPDLLFLDEVFEIGDQGFRAKSSSKIKELARDGSGVILVSHELKMIEKHCKRVLWLEKGKVKMMGETEEVLRLYREAFPS